MVRVVIFISSPGDVGQERSIANNVVGRLSQEFQGRLEFVPYRWEFDALGATIDYQTQIDKALAASDIAIFIVWTRMGSRLDPKKFQRADGSAYRSGTEFEYARAKEMLAEKGHPEILFYRRDDNGSLKIEEKVLSQARLLIRFLKREFLNSDGTWKGAIHHFVKPEEFEHLLENHLRVMANNRLEIAPNGRHWKESPYRGLRVFEFEDAAIYCGRTAIIAEVVSLLKSRAREGLPFLMIQGMSGAGKSSLVRAGLLPHISLSPAIERVSVWRRAVFRPTENPLGPIASFADALLASNALPELAGIAADLQLLIRTPDKFASTVREALGRATTTQRSKDRTTNPESSAHLVIVIDQFEELFSESVNEAERNALVLSVVALLKGGNVWGIGTMRADFSEAAGALPESFRDYLRGVGRYTLGGPRRSEIAEIIRRPARQNGYEFQKRPNSEETLDDVLLHAAAEDPKVLPLLEFTLDELCKRAKDDGILKFADYDELGGIDHAIGMRAESVFTGLSKQAQAALPFLLGQLIHIEPRDVRVLARSSIPMARISRNAGAMELAGAFVKAWLLVADTGSDGAPTIGFAHEALTRGWPRIADWIRANVRALRQRAAISAHAQRWDDHGRTKEYLAEGQLLKEGRELLHKEGEFLPDMEAMFVRKSTRMHWARRTWLGAELVAASIAVAVITIKFDAVTNFSRAVLTLVKVHGSTESPPLSARAQANLQESIKRLSGHLSGRMAQARSSTDGSFVPWMVAQASIALAEESKAAPDSGPWLRQFMSLKRKETCNCWTEASGSLEHRVATAWVMDSLATSGQAAESHEMKTILDAQSDAGWWSVFPSTPDTLNASTSATAWNLHALSRHLSANLVPVPDLPRVCSSVARGMDWLLESPSRRSTSRWAEYPPGQTFESQGEYLAPSAFAIHVLNEYRPDPATLRAWLDDLPYSSPDLGTYDRAKAHVKQSDTDMTLDEVRHYQYPWMIMATVDAYPHGGAMQRARATVWLERALRDSITISDQCDIARSPRLPLTTDAATLRTRMVEPANKDGSQLARFALTITAKQKQDVPRFGFTEPLPSDYIVARTPNLATTCGGTTTAKSLSASLHLAGGRIPADRESCELQIDIEKAEPVTSLCVPKPEDWTMSEILIALRYLDRNLKTGRAPRPADPCATRGVIASTR